MKKMYLKHWLTISLLAVVLVINTADSAFSQSDFQFGDDALQVTTSEITSINRSYQIIHKPLIFENHQTVPNRGAENSGNLNAIPNVGITSNVQEPYAVHEFKVRNIPTVSIRSNNGSIKLEKSNDGKVRIEMYVTRRGLAILSSERLDDYRFVFRQRHDNIYAEVISTKNSAWSSNTPAFDFVVF